MYSTVVLKERVWILFNVWTTDVKMMKWKKKMPRRKTWQQVAAVKVATARIVAAQIIPRYSPGNANVQPSLIMVSRARESLPHDTTSRSVQPLSQGSRVCCV